MVQKFKRVGGRSTKFSLDMTSSNENDEEIEDEASEVSVGTSDGRELAEGDEATDESYRESAEQKRLRLAKDYLSKFELSSNAENEETVSNDRGNYQCDSSSISDELRVQRLQRHGEHFQDLSDHFKAVAENIELDDVNSTTKLGGHCQPVTCVALSKSDMYVVSGSKDNSILMWDLNDSSHARRELRPKWSKFNSGNEQRLAGEILAVCISSDDRYIASGGRDSMVRIFDSRQRFAEVHAFSGHRGSVNALTFQSNSSKLFSGSSDGCVKHWSVSDFAYIETLFGHQVCAHLFAPIFIHDYFPIHVSFYSSSGCHSCYGLFEQRSTNQLIIRSLSSDLEN